jgi:hypothetical protein
MRCSFRTHLFSRMRFPGLAPWAGMHCPLQGNLQFLGRCPAWYAVPRWGKLNNGISIPRSCPNEEHRVPTCRRGSVGANPAITFSFPCPNGASHTSPGYQPWESPGKRNPRSEGTPHSLRVSERFLRGDRIRRSGFGVIVLKDVAWGPSVETGAGVPGYSGGVAVCAVVSYLDFCSRGSLTPVAAPNVF